MQLSFNYDWCSYHFPRWKKILGKYKPTNVLEIGSFEGRSSVFWASQPSVINVDCIDTWEGGEEHDRFIDFKKIEETFDNNIQNYNINKHKGLSREILLKLAHDNKKFELIYIDGSHKKEDVMTDAVLSYQLCKKNSVIIFDDYFFYDSYRFEDWKMDKPNTITSHPKTAIDAFVNIYEDNIRTISVGRQYVLEILNDI